MSTWYFTFGQQYRYDPHPAGGHPDGWFAVEAKDSNQAREKMFGWCGPQWAMQYDEEPSYSMYPLGELTRIP